MDPRTLLMRSGKWTSTAGPCARATSIRTSTEDPIRCLRADELNGDESMLIDYTPENWLFDAVGQPWLPLLPKSLTDERGYSPLPTQTRYAEVFNAYVKAINILTRARSNCPF